MSEEPAELGKLTQALRIDPTADSTYAYFRSNATSWGADGASLMTEVSPNVWVKTFTVNEAWVLEHGLPMNVSLTNAMAGWGSQNASLTDSACRSPACDYGRSGTLVEGYLDFRVRFPALAEYQVTFDAAALTYSFATPTAVECGPDLEEGQECRLDDFESGADGWYEDQWQPTSTLTWQADAGRDQSGGVIVDNAAEPNDARWVRDVALPEAGYYTLRGWLRGDSIDGGPNGANFSIINTWDTSLGSFDGLGTFDWTEVAFTFPPQPGSTPVAARVGMYGSTVTGTGWFDDVRIARLVETSGAHVELVLDGDDVGTISAAALSEWIGRLDLAYDAYADLVGGVPYGGDPITVLSVEQFPGGWAVAGDPIMWHRPYVVESLDAVEADDDWSFGILHEIGHDFDLDYRWVWDAEYWANLKMYYVLDVLAQAGYAPKVHQGHPFSPGQYWVGTEIRDYYGACTDVCAEGQTKDAGDGCNTCTCSEYGTWHCTENTCGTCSEGDAKPYGDGCNVCICNADGGQDCPMNLGGTTIRLIEVSELRGWTPYQATFRWFNGLTQAEYDQLLADRVAAGESEAFAKFNLFIDRLSLEAALDVRSLFTAEEMAALETSLR